MSQTRTRTNANYTSSHAEMRPCSFDYDCGSYHEDYVAYQSILKAKWGDYSPLSERRLVSII